MSKRREGKEFYRFYLVGFKQVLIRIVVQASGTCILVSRVP